MSTPAVTPAPGYFQKIFWAVFSLTVALLATRVGVAVFVEHPTESLKDAMATCNQLATAGFGAILGLIGSKIN